jgi:transglutaminase-like putative cysteine protease
VSIFLQVRFYDTFLAPGPPEEPVPDLPTSERSYYLDEHWRNDEEHRWFRNLMQEENMARSPNESDLDYGVRALQFVSRTFRYEIPDGNPRWKQITAEKGSFGDWLYTWETRSGECLRISQFYADMLREAGIPVRQVSGNWVEGDHGHHLRDLIWLTGIGWVPVEPTSAVTDSRAHGSLKYFSYWGGAYLAGNESVDFHVPWRTGTFNCGTFDTLWYLFDDGRFHMTTARVR